MWRAMDLFRGPTPAEWQRLSDPQVHGLFHECPEASHVENQLGLNEIGSGHGFFLQVQRPDIDGLRERIGRSADEQWRAAADDRFSALKATLVAHLLQHADQLRGIDVMHVLGARVIAMRLVIAGQAQHVLDAVRSRTEDVALDGQTVAIAASDLDYRLHTLVQHDEACADAAHAHDGGLVIGDVGGIDVALQQGRLPAHLIRIETLGRTDLAGHDEMPGGERTLQVAARPPAVPDR
jgi:hypothetical protein